MKYYIIAGERSGDLHASNLMKALKKRDPQADFRVWGGEYMQQEGGVLVKHYNELAFMGFIEVLKNINQILGFISFCKKDIISYAPDVVILVDYAGFNMRIAKFLKSVNIKAYYYISPKIWAWNQSRAYKIKKFIDRMFVILPFEKEFYKKFDFEVDYVGNPVLDAIRYHHVNPNFKLENNLTDCPIIAILPGSRKQEVAANLQKMLTLTHIFPNFQFVVAAVPNLPPSLFDVPAYANIKVVFGKTFDLLAVAHAAIVTSGTATLETALFNVPQVVCYMASPISYLIGKSLVKVKYISLVNLLVDKEIVKELIQHDFTTANLVTELKKIASDEESRKQQLAEYQKMRNTLGDMNASENTAELMIGYLREGPK